MVFRLGALAVAAAACALAGCRGTSSGASPLAPAASPSAPMPTVLPTELHPPTPTPAPLTLSAQSVTFDIFNSQPQTITVTSASNFGGALHALPVDGTRVGATVSMTGTGSATVSLIPISGGSTSVTLQDAIGARASIAVTQLLCGRPDNLRPASTLIYPQPGASGVSPAVGRLYFAVTSVVAPSPILHVWTPYGTLEGSALTAATPPPGAASFTPGPNVTVMAATIGTLPISARVTTQIYDDPCQPPIPTGTFDTASS
jgi:hypothetical protein